MLPVGGIRRHHCRACGRSVCDSDSQHTMEAPGYAGPERACDVCFNNRQSCLAAGKSPQSGAQFKKDLAAGIPKFGIFLNSASPTVTEQFAHSGYDWLLVDCQHGPMNAKTMSAMLCAISSGGVMSMVRVAGYDDRSGIQQALDLGADGILIPYINTAAEAKAGVSCCLYPSGGTRSVYFPQRSMNKAGLLGYAGGANGNVIIALQVETADCIANMEEICAVPRVDMLFLGQNDLCMSMGLFEEAAGYEFPEMYTSPELQAATDKLIACAQARNILLGMFQFGTDRVAEFLDKGFNFISVGNDLHHILTQNFAHKEALVACSVGCEKPWTPQQTAVRWFAALHSTRLDTFAAAAATTVQLPLR